MASSAAGARSPSSASSGATSSVTHRIVSPSWSTSRMANRWGYRSVLARCADQGVRTYLRTALVGTRARLRRVANCKLYLQGLEHLREPLPLLVRLRRDADDGHLMGPTWTLLVGVRFTVSTPQQARGRELTDILAGVYWRSRPCASPSGRTGGPGWARPCSALCSRGPCREKTYHNRAKERNQRLRFSRGGFPRRLWVLLALHRSQLPVRRSGFSVNFPAFTALSPSLPSLLLVFLVLLIFLRCTARTGSPRRPWRPAVTACGGRFCRCSAAE